MGIPLVSASRRDRRTGEKKRTAMVDFCFGGFFDFKEEPFSCVGRGGGGGGEEEKEKEEEKRKRIRKRKIRRKMKRKRKKKQKKQEEDLGYAGPTDSSSVSPLSSKKTLKQYWICWDDFWGIEIFVIFGHFWHIAFS